MGAQARLMSHALRKITANASKCHTTVLFLNQLRMKVSAPTQAASAACLILQELAGARSDTMRRPCACS